MRLHVAAERSGPLEGDLIHGAKLGEEVLPNAGNLGEILNRLVAVS